MSSTNILLGVNIDHCATLRQARYRGYGRTRGGIVEPDPVALALAAELAGAGGITVHLREDRRHIQQEDVERLRACVKTRLNLEMACTNEMVAFALELKPDSVCLVPENRTEITTEGGLDVLAQKERVRAVVGKMTAANIITSLFIDAETAQIKTAAELKSPCVEFHTGAFANAWHDPAQRKVELEKLRSGCILAHELGVTVNAGHGINYVNIAGVRSLPHLHELNIGHSILSRALFTGIEEAVREMKRLMAGG